MARQKGIIPIEGTIGNLSFYKSVYGDLVRRKSSLTKKRVKTDPAFVRSREASREFGRAGSAGAVLRKAVRQAGVICNNTRTHYRLNKVMYQMIHADSIHARGERTILPEHQGLLRGFDWNDDYPLYSQLLAHFTTDNTVAGQFHLNINAFSPDAQLNWRNGATHAELFMLQIAADFERKSAVAQLISSGVIARTDPPRSLTLTATTSGTHVITGLGVRFYELVDGELKLFVGGGCFMAI